jgi:hypothetical protein
MYAALSPELSTAEEVAAAHATTTLESFKEELAELVVQRLNPIQVDTSRPVLFCICGHMAAPLQLHLSGFAARSSTNLPPRPAHNPNLKTRLAELEADPGYVNEVLASGAQRARACAASTVQRLKDVMGLT